MKSKRLGDGFTIVELLIVVVVIAILAAITIIAYNGIQQRAKTSALQSAASQIGKKMLAYGVQNSDTYPADVDFSSLQSSIGLPAESATNTYSYYASDDRKSFCLSTSDTTANPVRSYAMTQSGTVVEGRCVKNLINNPSFESSLSSWTAGQVTYSLNSTWSSSGSQSVKLTPNSTSSDTYAHITLPVGTGVVDANEAYTMSGTFYQVAAQSGTLDGAARTRRLAGYSYVNATPAQLGLSTMANNTAGSVRQQMTFTVTQAGATSINLRLYDGAANSADNSVYWDGIMLTKGSTLYSYGDGSLPNWAWTGAAHSSASFGPAVAQ